MTLPDELAEMVVRRTDLERQMAALDQEIEGWLLEHSPIKVGDLAYESTRYRRPRTVEVVRLWYARMAHYGAGIEGIPYLVGSGRYIRKDGSRGATIAMYSVYEPDRSYEARWSVVVPDASG